MVVVDDLSTGRVDNLRAVEGEPGFQMVTADISSLATSTLGDVTMGVHLAARTEVAASIEDPAGTVEANVLGSVHVLEALRLAGARSAVVASSAAVYGEVPVPVDEEGPHSPISPYGAGKLAVDHFVRYYAHHTDMAACSLRFFNVYGPRQHPRSPYSGVISVFARQALEGRDLVINGDGMQTRDFVYAGDVCEAIMSALVSPDARGEAINIGTGRATTIRELAGMMVEVTGSPSQVTHGPSRPGDIRHSVAKVDKAESLLHFRAGTTLSEGLETTVHWMRDQVRGGRPTR